MTTAPGVYVTTSVSPRPAGAAAPAAATLFIRQPLAYGSLAPQKIDASYLASPAAARQDLIAALTGSTSATQLAASGAVLRSFFAEGGQTAYLARAVGDDAVAAGLTYTDGDDPVITIRSRWVGSYGNFASLELGAGTVSGKKLTISTTDAGILGFDQIILDNLADANAVAAAFAANPLLAAEFVTIIADGQGDVEPTTPSALTSLSGGVNGIVGLGDAFPPELGPGIIYDSFLTIDLLGDASDTASTLLALGEEAEAGRRMVLIDGPTWIAGITDWDSLADDIYDAAVAAVGQDRADDVLGYVIVPASPILAPSVVGPVQASSCGYVAGVRARTIAAIGPHRAPAGDVSIARYILGPTTDGTTIDAFDDPKASDAHGGGLNAIRVIAGTTRLYDWQTLARSADWQPATSRDTLNTIAADADARAETIAFRPIDGHGQVFADLNAILRGVAEDYKAAGAIFPEVADDGTETDAGYIVDTGSTVNTPDTIAAGQINGRLGVRITPTGAIVNIDVAKVAVGASL